MEQILSYFPDLTEMQQKQFSQLGDLYKDWNAKRAARTNYQYPF